MDNDLLKELINLAKDHTSANELITGRMVHLEKDVESLNHLLKGNGEPGLNEKVRNLEKIAKRIDIENLIKDRAKLKTLFWGLNIAGGAIIVLLIKAFWGLLTIATPAMVLLLKSMIILLLIL